MSECCMSKTRKSSGLSAVEGTQLSKTMQEASRIYLHYKGSCQEQVSGLSNLGLQKDWGLINDTKCPINFKSNIQKSQANNINMDKIKIIRPIKA